MEALCIYVNGAQRTTIYLSCVPKSVWISSSEYHVDTKQSQEEDPGKTPRLDYSGIQLPKRSLEYVNITVTVFFLLCFRVG